MIELKLNTISKLTNYSFNEKVGRRSHMLYPVSKHIKNGLVLNKLLKNFYCKDFRVYLHLWETAIWKLWLMWRELRLTSMMKVLMLSQMKRKILYHIYSSKIGSKLVLIVLVDIMRLHLNDTIFYYLTIQPTYDSQTMPEP